MTSKIQIRLSESGYECEIDTDEYRQHGELPEDYGYDNEGEGISWYTPDYARTSLEWSEDELADWPEHLPVWVGRG